MQADAIEDATAMQVKALQQQRDFVYKNLDPAVVNEQAAGADIQRAQQRLALQSQLDPSLLATRYVSQDKLLELAQQGAESQGDELASQLFSEAKSQLGDTREEQLKSALIDAALEEVGAGAALPEDVQAELVKAGLERAGTVGLGSDSRGLAGKLTRKLIASEAINLKKARQDQATRLGLAANELGNRRISILSSVFPQLKNLQAQNVSQNQSLLEQSNRLVPEVGLGGTDIANIFQARVGATNTLAQSAADAAARGAIGQSAAFQQGLGAAASYAGNVTKELGGDSTTTAGILKGIFA